MIAMQLASDVDAAIALRAAGAWDADLLMRFNMKKGKSMEPTEHDSQNNVCRTLGGDAFRGSHSDSYLVVGLSAGEARVDTVESRADGASVTLATLKLYKALVRDMYLT